MRTPAHQQSRKLSLGSIADLREQCHISHSQDYLHLPKNGMPSVPNALPNSYSIDLGRIIGEGQDTEFSQTNSTTTLFSWTVDWPTPCSSDLSKQPQIESLAQ